MSWGYAKQKLLGISVFERRNSQDSQDCALFRAELVGVSIIWGNANSSQEFQDGGLSTAEIPRIFRI